VETTEGVRSAVHQVSLTYHNGVLSRIAAGGFNTSFTGEAIAVDLGARGVLFVLLRPDSLRNDSGPAWGTAIWSYPEHLKGVYLPATLDAINRHTGPADVPFNLLPLLVRFRDLSDPRSVERVDPEHLDATFGPGVRLTRATVEITSDPITTGMDFTHPERTVNQFAFKEGT
jgi:hypothetical protein